MKVFLGGTVNGSMWRSELIPLLSIDYFNPIVKEWDEAAYQRELRERETCDILLYLITPLATGFYSIAEVVDDSNKRPERTVLCVVNEDQGKHFDKHQKRSLDKIEVMVKENGGTVLNSLEEVAEFLNTAAEKA